ncbi:MAG: gamma carbonic anhydrase family protein [Prevotellaceae bacterium]|jgi:carbonic anhydrase/acetyltransferase-like protein (isoleucine patch superfamily)|nr:gamma carbonic anhydrase family protein [Prevotellaceae bacterium]
MALIKTVRGFIPQIGKDCFLADNATIIGDVVIGDGCSIWFNAVLRGDVNAIRIGNHVNIQDGAVLHTLYQKSQVHIGDYVSIGHNVIVHGATIEDYALIGMGATLLDHVIVGHGAIVAANALVLTGTVIEPNTIWAGVPAKRVKAVAAEQSREMNQRIAHDYAMYAGWFKESDNLPDTQVDD